MAAPGLPIREQILANIVTTLAAVTAGDTYASDLSADGQVTRGHISPLEHFHFPCVSLLPIDDPTEHRPQVWLQTLTVTLRMWIDAVPATAPTALELLLADVTTIMKVDDRRGGLAQATLLRTTQYLYDAVTERIAGADQTWEIEYRTGLGHPRAFP